MVFHVDGGKMVFVLYAEMKFIHPALFFKTKRVRRAKKK